MNEHNFFDVCWDGRKDLVLSMIDKGEDDWDSGLSGACRGGHKDLVLLMIDKGATDWNWGLMCASKGRYKELALLMIEKGADMLWCGIKFDNDEVEYLVRRKNKYMIEKYPGMVKYCFEADNIVKNSGIMIKDLLSIVTSY